MKKRTRSRVSRARTTRSLHSSDAFVTFTIDQLGELGAVTPRRMFGGVGLYVRGVFFGIIAHDALYLKVDARNRARFEDAGSRPFKPSPDGPGSMKYYEVPLGVLESAPDLVRWARESVRAAERATRGV